MKHNEELWEKLFEQPLGEEFCGFDSYNNVKFYVDEQVDQ